MLKRTLPLLAAAAVLALAACSAPESTPAEPGDGGGGSGAPSATTVASPAPLCEYLPTGEPAKPVDPPPTTDIETTGEVSATLEMTEGPVSFTMDRGATPCAVNSFVSLATQGYFDDTSCHRLVDSGIFVLQCGDPTGTGTGGPGYSFADELTGEETYEGGVVAMANGGADTNGSQFFLVYDDSPLDPNFTVLGTMDEESRGIVARMAAEGQDGSLDPNPGGGKPNNPAEITGVTVG